MTDQEKPADKSPPPPPPPYDATLDLRSDQFDPLKALYATSMQLPHPNATIFDNIGKFESWLNADKLKKNDGTTRPKVAENDEPIFERRFLPHQMMVPGAGPKPKFSRNLLKKIDNDGFDGPMAALKQYRDDRARVKIYTRKQNGICGYITGYLLVFDKDWNMVLEDVHEVWKRRKAYLCAVADCRMAVDTEATVEDCAQRLRDLNITLPAVTAKSLSRKWVECRRQVGQLLIRGEHVVVVMLANEMEDKKVIETVNDEENVERVEIE